MKCLYWIPITPYKLMRKKVSSLESRIVIKREGNPTFKYFKVSC